MKTYEFEVLETTTRRMFYTCEGETERDARDAALAGDTVSEFDPGDNESVAGVEVLRVVKGGGP